LGTAHSRLRRSSHRAARSARPLRPPNEAANATLPSRGNRTDDEANISLPPLAGLAGRAGARRDPTGSPIAPEQRHAEMENDAPHPPPHSRHSRGEGRGGGRGATRPGPPSLPNNDTQKWRTKPHISLSPL